MTISQRRALNRVRMTPHNFMADSSASDKRKLLHQDDLRWPVVAIVCAVVVLCVTASAWVR